MYKRVEEENQKELEESSSRFEAKRQRQERRLGEKSRDDKERGDERPDRDLHADLDSCVNSSLCVFIFGWLACLKESRLLFSPLSTPLSGRRK